MNKINLSQYPVPLDVADIVTALVKIGQDGRLDVIRRVCHEVGTGWMR